MAYTDPRQLSVDFAAAVRAWTVAPLSTAAVRVGPQRDMPASVAVIVEIEDFGSETPAGSGNTFWREPVLRVMLMVEDDNDDPEASETLRGELTREFYAFVRENRTLNDDAKSGHITKCPTAIVGVPGPGQRQFRASIASVQYKCLMGKYNPPA